MRKITMILIICFVGLIFAQNSKYRIRRWPSGYAVKLEGKTSTRTAGQSVVGSYSSTFAAHEFEITVSGRYDLYYDSAGGTDWTKDSNWSGDYGHFIGMDDLSETIDPDANNQIDAAGLETGCVTSTKILDGTIVGADISDRTISSAKIGSNTLTAAEIASSAISTDEIANSAVTSAKLSSFAIDSSNIASQGVAHSNLQLQSVENNNVKNGTLTLSKFTPASLTQIGAPDTIIGLTADDRTLEDVGGGDIGFKMRSDVVNYQVFVSKDADDSYYQTIATGLAAFPAMSSSQQGVLYIYPGTYNESVALVNYVNIVGLGEGVIISDSLKAESGDTLTVTNIQFSKLYTDLNSPSVRIQNCYLNGSVPIIHNSGDLRIYDSEIRGASGSEPAIDVNGGTFYLNFNRATFAKIQIDDATGTIEGGIHKINIAGNWGVNIDNSTVDFKNVQISGITTAEVDSTLGPDVEIDSSTVNFYKCIIDGPTIVTGNSIVRSYDGSGYGKARLACGSGTSDIVYYNWSPVFDWTFAGGAHNVEMDAGTSGSITLYNPNINFTSYKGEYEHNGNPLAIYDGSFYCYGGTIRDGGGDGNSYSSMIGVTDSCDNFVIDGTNLIFDGDVDEATNGISITNTPSANFIKNYRMTNLNINLNGTGHAINWNGLNVNTINDSDSIIVGNINFKSRNSSAHKFHDGYYNIDLVAKLFPYLKNDLDIDFYRNVTINNDMVVDSTLIVDQTKTKMDSGRVYLTIGQDNQTDSTYNTILFYKSYYASLAGDSDSVKVVIEFKDSTQVGAATQYNDVSFSRMLIYFVRTASADIACHLAIKDFCMFDNGTVSGTTKEVNYTIDSLTCSSTDYYVYPGITKDSCDNGKFIFKINNYWPNASHTAAIFLRTWNLVNIKRIYFEDY